MAKRDLTRHEAQGIPSIKAELGDQKLPSAPPHDDRFRPVPTLGPLHLIGIPFETLQFHEIHYSSDHRINLVGGIPTRLKNMKVNRKDDIPYIMENKTYLKPPTSNMI
jgi:hypothetical protein